MTPLHPFQARQQYLSWLRSREPALYDAAMQYAAQHQTPTLGDVSSDLANGQSAVTNTSLWDKIIDGVSKLGTAYLGYKSSKDLVKINTQRAQQGLPPLDSSEYGVGVNVGLNSGTRNDITQWLLIGGGIIVGVLLLKKLT